MELKPKYLGRVREILLGVPAGYYKRLKVTSKAYVKKQEFIGRTKILPRTQSPKTDR